MALANPQCTSQTVLECKHRLSQLGASNDVTILWIPVHSNLMGNNVADSLANFGSPTPLIDPTTVLKLGTVYAEVVINQWVHQLEDNLWVNQNGLRLSERLINADPHYKAIN